MKSRSKKLSEELLDSYGGFHDLATFRAETGMTANDLSDQEALTVINEDLQEQKRIADVERQRAETKARETDQLRTSRDTTLVQHRLLQSELDQEKAKRKSLEDALSPYRPANVQTYLERERLKKEIKDEMDFDKKVKSLNRALSPRRPARQKSRSRQSKPSKPSKQSKPRQKSKSRRSKSKTQAKSRSKSKSKSRA